MVRNIIPLGLLQNKFIIRQDDLIDATFKLGYTPVGDYIEKLKRDTQFGVCYQIERSELVSYVVTLDAVVIDVRHNGQVIVITCKELIEVGE